MIYLVMGRRETGKTTLALHVARKFPARLIFDPRAIIDGPSTLRVREADDLAMAVDELLCGEQTEVAYAPTDDDLAGAFDGFAGEVKRWVLDAPSGRSVAVLVDEASFVDLHRGAWQWVLRCAPRDTVHLLLTVHRPVDVPVIVRGLADHWLIFRTRQEHDVRVLAERTTPDVAAVVEQLGDREFVHWDDELARYAIVRRADRWFVPLTPATGREVSFDA